MKVRESRDGSLVVDDMIAFSLKFMLRRPDTLYFFIPSLVFGVLVLLTFPYASNALVGQDMSGYNMDNLGDKLANIIIVMLVVLLIK